jgi:hypothetical protein
MKRLSFLAILIILLTVAANAQVQNRATIEWIKLDNPPGADPFLCIFGNSVEDVSLIDYFLDLNGADVMYLSERIEQTTLPQAFINEMIRLNARFLNIHTIQRRIDDKKGIVDYFHVDIIERVGNKYYIIASNY